MSLHLKTNEGKTLEMEITGKLEASDFQNLENEFTRVASKYGKLRVLVRLMDFHGWDGIALWDEVKFDVKHYRDLERLAVVGDSRWEKLMSTVARLFTSAETRYFDHRALEQARVWLETGSAEPNITRKAG